MNKNNIYYINVIKNIKNVIAELDKINTNDEYFNYRSQIELCIFDSLHAIGDLHIRLDNSIKNSENIINAFQYLNNQIKHIEDLDKITYAVSASTYPMFFPTSFGNFHFCWLNFSNKETRANPLRPQYEKYLMDRDIKTSYIELLDYINIIIKD